MRKFTESLYAEMNEALNQIAMTSENELLRAEQSYYAVRDTIRKLKEFILGYDFSDKEEEIRFFKEIKPSFEKELIYFTEMFYIESGKPVGSREIQLQYYNQALEPVRLFFGRNQFLYTYYRTGKTQFDEQFFLREASDEQLLPEDTQDIDPRFSTVHGFKIARLQALEQLRDYIQQALRKIENGDMIPPEGKDKAFKSHWTDSKAALIELAYALHSRGSINQGKGDVKQIISDLEILFNIRLGNFYRTFQNMRIRKKNRTAYLDILKDSLEKRMDETDMGDY